VPARLAPSLDTHDVVNEQLCVVLKEHYNLPMTKVQEHLEAVAADSVDARHLGLRRGEPVLRLNDVISNAEGTPFEYSTIVFRGDKLRLRFDYEL
jgi:GntR family transcriptional regulator